MTEAEVIRLADRRPGRRRRWERAVALHRLDPSREPILRELLTLLAQSGSDRAALVWAWEFATDLLHVHTLVDLAADTPRRTFPIGCPFHALYRREGQLWVLMGDDARREWPVFQLAVAGGHLTGLLIQSRTLSPLRNEIAGDGPLSVVLEWIRGLVYDGGVARPGFIKRCRAGYIAIARSAARGDRELLLRALRVAEAPGLLGRRTFKLAEQLERTGRLQIAEGAYRVAAEAAIWTADLRFAWDVAAGLGRCLRKLARWDESAYFYRTALEIGQLIGAHDLSAIALDGLGNLSRTRGALPTARATYEQALVHARRSGDALALSRVHTSLSALQSMMGDPANGIRHAVEALRHAPHDTSRARVLNSLGAMLDLIGAGDLAVEALAAAEKLDIHDAEVRLLTTTNAAEYAAKVGDGPGFISRARRVGIPTLAGVSRHFAAMALRSLAIGFKHLGDASRSDRFERRVQRLAERHRLTEFLFHAESEDPREIPEPLPDHLVASVQEGLAAISSQR